MAEKTTTVIVELDFDTNNDVVSELAVINKEVSKQAGGYKTKTQLLSEIIKDHFYLKRNSING